MGEWKKRRERWGRGEGEWKERKGREKMEEDGREIERENRRRGEGGGGGGGVTN